jgi:hypothetical protein
MEQRIIANELKLVLRRAYVRQTPKRHFLEASIFKKTTLPSSFSADRRSLIREQRAREIQSEK